MIVGVIMAGGVGERFWPLSRQNRPKQLLHIMSEQSFLQETIERIAPLIPPERLFIITSMRLKAPICRELPDFPADNVIGEPEGRNTAACLALAEVVVSARFPGATMAVLTADHIIGDPDAFIANVGAACRYAEESGGLITVGIPPTRPETGFGYIETGDLVHNEPHGRIHRVKRFLEKPDRTTAERFLADGRFLWNSGMFFWTLDALRSSLETYLPATMKAMKEYRTALGTPEAGSVLARTFSGLEKISIDCAVMEKAPNVFVVEADFQWDDLGTWNALERALPADASGNIVLGKALPLDSRGVLIHNKRENAPMVAAFGLEDILVVVDHDVILVCPKSRAPELKNLVAGVREKTGETYL